MANVNAWVLAAFLVACAGAVPPVRIIPQPPPEAVAAAPSESGLSLVFTGDLNGLLMGDNPRRSGLTALAGRVEAIPAPKLVLDNGDAWFGNATSNMLDGQPVIEAYDVLGVRAVNMGNHELDAGIQQLHAVSQQASFTLLTAGLERDGDSIGRAWQVFDAGGLQVGVIGMRSEEVAVMTRRANVDGLVFAPPEETWRALVDEVRAAGAEIVVLMMHDEPARVRHFMRSQGLEGVDLVVCSALQPGFHTRVEGTPLVQPGGLGRSIAVARVVRRAEGPLIERVWLDNGEVSRASARQVNEIIDNALDRAAERLGEVVGVNSANLPVGDFHASPLGHFVVDTWLERIRAADVALLNIGALRLPLLEGTVTRGQLVDALPYDDGLVTLRVRGDVLRAALALGPIVGGVRYRYTETREGRSILEVVHRDGWVLTDDREVVVVVPEFMAEGGDGFPFAEVPSRPTGERMRSAIEGVLRSATPARRPPFEEARALFERR